MEGKIRYVRRETYYRGAQEYQHSYDVHDIRETNTFAVLYSDSDGDIIYVNINKDEIKDYYGYIKITKGLIN